jgi:hypothetical protein
MATPPVTADGVPIDYPAVVGSLMGELNIQATCSWSAEEDDDDAYVPPLDPLAEEEELLALLGFGAEPAPPTAPKTPEERRAENLALAEEHRRLVGELRANAAQDERRRQARRGHARDRRRRTATRRPEVMHVLSSADRDRIRNQG